MSFLLVVLEVEDIERSLAFYHDLLELPIIERFRNKKGDEITMLGEKEHAHIELICKGNPVKVQPEGMAVSFAVTDAMAVVEKNGREFTGPICPGPDMRFYFTYDPDGYRVQLQETIF